MSQSTRLRPDAEACQSHSAAHRDGSLAPNPPAGLVPKDHPPTRSRRGSGGVRVLAAVACLAWLAWPTEAFAQQVTLNVDAVAGDNKINQSEHRNVFNVSGNTGTESGVTVEVTIGGTPLTSVTSAMNAMWSVNVEPSAAYITETSVELSVTATKTGFTSATVTRTLPVDLTPPSVSYTAPSSLKVGVLIIPIAPTTSDTDIVSYATSGGSLPLGLVLNGATGLISGEPRTANTNTQTVGVLVTDDAGNVDRPQIRFPAVELAAGVTFSPAALFVPEGGSAGYTVVFDAQPTDDVTITVTRWGGGDEDLTATPDILTFTDSNWDTPQTVTVSAAEDADGKAGSASFRHAADSLDGNYKGIPLNAVRVTEDDNDEIGVTVSPQRLMVLEGGSAGYTVVLNTQPTDDVTVEANPDQRSDDDLTVSSDTDMDTYTDRVTLTFTDSNWDTPQTVTVSAAEDADESNGTATFSHNVVSLYTFDDDYADEDLTIDSVTATEVDAEIEPEVAITSNATGPVSGPFEVTITFSEPVEGFEREDIKIRNGTVVDFTEVSSSEYRITITPAQAGRPVAITISENVAEDGHGNGNQAVFFLIGVVLQVSFEEESYTATEGGETVTVTVKLSLGWKEELAIPIRVRRPETTEVSDYTVEGLEGWEAEEGVGKLIIGAGETEGSFKIQANSDGDGDDETVELGFGELPKRVMTGKPAKATLTLKDKGLVELKVSFGQAEYQIKEGHQADIEVTISPAADRRVEVPLEVALEGGATPEDYSGVPVSVVFEEGESQGTISVEALADEENDPGEGIVLSLGGLPEAVSAGDPSSTQVHFRQQRTAEQFSRTLEVMLAVIARSTAESAQTAIEGRFERHRQLSRMGSSGGAMQQAPKPGTSEAARGGAPASSHSGTGLGPEESAGAGRGSIDDTGSRGEEGPVEPGAWVTAKTRPATGWGWDLESQQRGTQGSWLRNFSLGGLGSIARSGQTHSGVSTGYGMGPSGTGLPVALGGQPGYGQNRFQGTGTRDSSLRPGSIEFSGMRGGGSLLESTLSRTSLELSLGEQEKEKGKNWVPVLWVQGDLLRFNGDLTRLGMNYRGGLKAAHVGLDLYANDQMLSGLSFMRSWGDMDYTDDGLDGVLDSRMNTVHPYLYWQPNERVSVWGIGGLGRGQVDVTEPSRTHDFDADFRMFAGGVRSVLTRRGNNEWGLRADAFTAQIETDASEGIAQVSGEAHRGRLMLEWVHDRELSAERSLNLKAEAGGRFDGGDAERGSGVETGVGLGYLDANRGLDVSLHGRVLVVHESDYRDWGVGVQASWDPGEKQRGFRVSVNSSLGQDGGGRTTLWDNADAVMHPAGMGAMGIGSQYRMESEVAYAGLEVRGVPGLLTPYSRLRRAGQGRELALGTQWSLPTRSQQALPLMLELEAMRRENRTGPADLGVLLRVSIPLGGSRDVISGRDRVSTQAPDPKLIPRGIAESEADGPQATAAAIKLPAELVSAPQPDANLPPEPATPEAALPASQPAQASAQPQGSAPPSTTTAPARGEERVVNVQPTPQPGARTTPQPQSAASPTQTAELQAQVAPQQLKPRRQSPPAVTPSDSSAPTVLPSGGMVVQVGAFRSAERGARLTDELRQKGHAAITITIGGSDYHRVVVGPFPSRSDAASAQSQLEQQGYQGITFELTLGTAWTLSDRAQQALLFRHETGEQKGSD